MAENISFKERVKNIVISEANDYFQVYVENSYLIFSADFKMKEYYVLAAEKDNYLHLIGVNTELKAKDFFEKCVFGTLTEEDFDFEKQSQNPNSVKGSVRRKINCLSHLNKLFESNELVFEEGFKKNSIICAIAASDQKVTLGFTSGKKSRPKTLLKGNELKKQTSVDLILSKKRNASKFDKVVYGDVSILKENIDKLKDVLSDDLKEKMSD